MATGPTPFGPFVLLRRLGTGGMAETYLAERRVEGAQGAGFGRAVCLKLILPEHTDDPEFLAWFFEEARIHGKLHHDNIVQVYDFGAYEGHHYLVLEYVEGCELRRLLRVLADHKRRLPHALSIAIAYELANALTTAHELSIDGVHQNLVHRDLSPHNVLLSVHGHAKLCDFGVVKAKSRAVRTETGTTKGKVPYMSPEQIVAPATIDGRTDLFALGVILFELLTGQHPFRRAGDENDAELLRRIVGGDRPRVDALVDDVPPMLAEIVEALLQTERQRRLPSATALARRLESTTLSAVSVRDLAAYVRAARIGKLPADEDVQSQTIPASMVPTRTRPVDEPAPAPSRPTDPPRSRRIPSWLVALSAVFAVSFAATLALRDSPREGAMVSTVPRSEAFSREPLRRGPSAETPRSAHEPVASISEGAEPPLSSSSSWPHGEANTLTAPPAVPAAVPTAPTSGVNVSREGTDEREAPLAPAAIAPSPAEEALASPGLHGDAPVAARSSGPSPAVEAKRVLKLSAPEAGEEAPASERNAWLDIVVAGDGPAHRVWVDGQYQGTADVKVKVAPGKHVVAVGVEGPTMERGVRASSHRTRQVLFRP
jgi:eukaryotic-like serine/threonine-protein kinase